jgi:hypothetical protein
MFLQGYNELESRVPRELVASQDDCEQAVKDLGMWFTENDICQFMNRREEDVEAPQPTDD